MSQHDGETKDIDGHTYRVRHLDPMTAQDMVVDLADILGPAIAAVGGKMMATQGDSTQMAEGADPDTVMSGESYEGSFERAILGVVQRLSKAKQREFIDKLAAVSWVVQDDGKEPKLSTIYAHHFRGRVMSAYRWLAFALRVQFADFFSALSPVIARFDPGAAAAP